MIPYCIVVRADHEYSARYPRFRIWSFWASSIEKAIASSYFDVLDNTESDSTLQEVFKQSFQSSSLEPLLVQLHSNSEFIPFEEFKHLYPEAFL